MATLLTKTKELEIDAVNCKLAAQMHSYEGVDLKIDPEDPRAKISPMRKERHCHYNS